MPFVTGMSSWYVPTAFGMANSWFAAAAAPVVAASLTLPAVDPATMTLILPTLPGIALTTVAAVMFNKLADAPILTGSVPIAPGVFAMMFILVFVFQFPVLRLVRVMA